MSDPFEYDICGELRRPLTKFEALKLAAMVLPELDKFSEQRDRLRMTDEQWEKRQHEDFFTADHTPSDELYLGFLFNFAQQIMEKDAGLINSLLQADKRLAYEEIMIQNSRESA